MATTVKFYNDGEKVSEIVSIGYIPADMKAVPDSKHLATSGAVAKAAADSVEGVIGNTIDGEELTIHGTGLTYEAGNFYASHDKILYCTTASSTEAEFAVLGGVVQALNYLKELLSTP